MQGPLPAPTIVCFAFGRAVHEVPSPERALLALDDQQRLAGHDEEVLLIRLPVVHRHRLARLEYLHVDAELREVLLAFQIAERAAPFDVVPARIARVEHVPAVTGRNEPVLRLLERRLRNHAPELATRTR